MSSPDPSAHAERVQRFLAYLNEQTEPPSWAQAAAHGVELVDLTLERETLAEHMVTQLGEVRRAQTELADSHDTLEANGTIHNAEEYITQLTEDLRVAKTRSDEIADRPGRYHLASGETIQHAADGHSHKAGWWFTDDQQCVTTPAGERFHGAGIHPTANIHPTAHIDPTARVETGATIAAGARVGAHVHIGREASVGPHAVIQQGAWIGPLSEVWNRTWVSPGATIGARSIIGNQATVGLGTQVAQRSEIEPHSRLGAGTSVRSTGAKNPHRGVQVATAIERLMTYDRE